MTITDHTTTDAERIRALEGCIKHLSAEVGRLHRELADFRADLAKEVRTGRLAVVDPDSGGELIYTTWINGQATLSVEAPDEDTGSSLLTSVYAGDGAAGVHCGSGDVLAHMCAVVEPTFDGSLSAAGAMWVESRSRRGSTSTMLDESGLALSTGPVTLRPTMAVEPR